MRTMPGILRAGFETGRMCCCLFFLLDLPASVMARQTVMINSSGDGSVQNAVFYCPSQSAPGVSGSAVPLLVVLHTWSGNHEQGLAFVPYAEKRKWIMIAPAFRGRNCRPEACASDLAVRDVLDAVEYARKHACVDDTRIYLVGCSGGGHMSLMMAARAPKLWAGVSAWVPISDLATWHAESLIRKNRYAGMIEACCGGPPGTQTEAQYRKRSPLFHLAAAKKLPFDINAGIHDGHTGSVPISHSVHAFNVLAEANGCKDRCVGAEAIVFMLRERRAPPSLAAGCEHDPERRKPILFRRVAGAVRLTLFDGGHEIETSAALDWLSRQRRDQPADHRVGNGVNGSSGSQEVEK